MPLRDHPTGNYRFLPGIAPYSCGVVSSPGFEIVHVTLQQPVPYQAGFDVISQHLTSECRPRSALCAVELRSPTPFTFAGFAEFNGKYAYILQSWDLFVDGINPVARTNVAPIIGAPAEPSLYGFSFTRPCRSDLSATFVVAGAGELPEGVLSRSEIVSLGDTTAMGMTRKATFVMDLMEARLHGLGADWADVSTIDVYTAHSLTPLLPEIILKRAGLAAIHGVKWHYSAPPILEIEFEMDLRGVRSETMI